MPKVWTCARAGGRLDEGWQVGPQEVRGRRAAGQDAGRTGARPRRARGRLSHAGVPKAVDCWCRRDEHQICVVGCDNCLLTRATGAKWRASRSRREREGGSGRDEQEGV
eukprot:6192752-Pleurochrysis_carterae.AAC.4